MKKYFFMFITTLLFASLLLAHGGHKHKTIMGTVQSIDASHIDLTTKSGKRLSVPLSKDTMFMRGDAMISAVEVVAGTRVVIMLGEDDKTAAHVKLGPAKKK